MPIPDAEIHRPNQRVTARASWRPPPPQGPPAPRPTELYYVENATQAQIAKRLGVSRPTVSRLLTAARRQGIVRIEIVRPSRPDDQLATQVRTALGLREVRLAALAPVVGDALLDVGLDHDDILLVSSGRTIYE